MSIRPHRICKVVLVGSSGIGKTSIATRFVSNTFSETLNSTHGAAHSSRKLRYDSLNNQKLKLEIWDTAGQEKYNSLNRIFFKDAAIAILVYDITQNESFLDMKNIWYENIKSFGPSSLIYGIAANKSDLFQKEEVNEMEGKNFAKEINATYYATSAKEGIGIDELFRELGERYLKSGERDNERKNYLVLSHKTQNSKKKCC